VYPIVLMIEAQLNYIAAALAHMRRRGATRLEVSAMAQDAYNARIQQRMAQTVWSTGGCTSWYLDRNGRNSTIWPDFTFRFWGELKRFDPQAYELAASAARGAPPAVAAA
jgi:hypothetical protein